MIKAYIVISYVLDVYQGDEHATFQEICWRSYHR